MADEITLDVGEEITPDRYQRLAELWACSVEEARRRDDLALAEIAKMRAARLARAAAVVDTNPLTEPRPVKKNGVADKPPVHPTHGQ